MSRSRPASGLCERYLDRMHITRGPLRAHPACDMADSREAMVKLQLALGDGEIDLENPAYASVRRRLALAHDSPCPEPLPAPVRDALASGRLATAPPVNRSSMAPQRWPSANRVPAATGSARTASRSMTAPTAHERGTEPCPDRPETGNHWNTTGFIRRVVLAILLATQTYVATRLMTSVLPYHGSTPLEGVILVFFSILSLWVAAGFWTAMAGFALQILGRDRHAISWSAAADAPVDREARTAIVMPICNENVRRVFAGLRATYESLARTGELQQFDLFVLSDSNDPDLRVAEKDAWFRLCVAVGGFGRVFYRWRRHRIKRKSGNIADFCRRWGRNYRYMIVLDADSVMSGECLTRLVRLMEANANAGIVQTAPLSAGRDTLYARLQQFANRVYGPLFTAGLHFWQLGESPYWGHNAIIRVAPFIRHCALARLPGRGALSGEILSHDFVEAALMRRAGWAVWIAYDLPGSYEEMPSNLVEELQRDRRWCRGNLINFRLLLADGLHPAHRAVFLNGAMAYVSAAFWFFFLVLCTARLGQEALSLPEYFTGPAQLFPIWPEWHPHRAIGLLGATATLLYLPKVLGVLLLLARGAREFGSGLRLVAGMLAESLFSTLAAPVRMLFHTRFVAAALMGVGINWKSPSREDTETGWGEALRRHGLDSLIGVAWTIGLYFLYPPSMWWFAPVTGALILSIPLSVYTSRISLGLHMRKLRLLLIPEESKPPPELRSTKAYAVSAADPPGFIEAVVDPVANALACATAPDDKRNATLKGCSQLEHAALHGGPVRLTDRQKMTVLNNPQLLSRLHFQVWTSADAHPLWRDACAHESLAPAAQTVLHGTSASSSNEYTEHIR